MHKERVPTHYEILGLKENCSVQEIRESFVNMSKKFHPDKNSKDPQLHGKFVQINEAYSVLSKIHSRRTYDVGLRRRAAFSTNVNSSTAENIQRWRDESIWPMQDIRNGKSYSHSYYGIKGIDRKPNSWIAAGAVILLGIGTLLHYIAIKHSITFSVSQLNQKNVMLLEELEKCREKSAANGNALQLEFLQEKLLSQKNEK